MSSSVVGPIQPYAGGGAVQENFRQMVDHVLSWMPDCPPQLVKRRINTKLRQIQDRRMWNGLLVRGQLVIPQVYTTGTVAVSQNNPVVAGIATNWPLKDLVDTTLSASISYVGELQDLVPASMDGINPGDWITFDGATGGTNREFVLVISTTPTSFKANPTKIHLVGETIWKSSLMRRQFRIGNTTSFYNVLGVYGDAVDGNIMLDLPWGHPAFGPGSAYQIAKIYVTLEQNLRMVWCVVNNRQGWRIRLNMPQEVLNTWDVWRQTTGWTYMMNDYIPDEIGRFQYELYPAPSTDQGLPYLAYRTVPNMERDEDTPPPAIPSHMLVNGCLADVLKYNPKSPYYDLNTARDFSVQFEQDFAAAVIADDSIYMNLLQWAFSQYPFNAFSGNFGGAAYRQSHDIDW